MNTEPDEAPDDSEFDDEDSEPSAEEIELMRSATSVQAEAVDTLLLASCSPRWQKVAMVIGVSLDEYDAKFPDLPYVFMQIRLLELVDRGVLDARGDVMAMRHSEVRLAGASAEA